MIMIPSCLFLLLILLSSHCVSSTKTQKKLRHNDEVGYNVLALGGSNTWGSQLANREDAWPFLLEQLGPHKVTNHALRATGSFYPALCLQSVLEGDNTEYNLIVLEFSINGAQAFDWLVKRLRARFPNAIVVYIHLYSVRSNVVDMMGKTPFDHGIIDNIGGRGIEWAWGVSEEELMTPPPQVLESIQPYDLHMYSLPYRKTPNEALPWFSTDAHHLSAKAHYVIANEVLLIANNVKPPQQLTNYKFGTWGQGDWCDNWFKSGEIKSPYTGAEMKPFLEDRKYALEFPIDGGTIEITNPGVRAPLWVHYMGKQNAYPRTKVSVFDRDFYLDPGNHNIGEYWHIVRTTNIGYAEQAVNTIRISPESDSHEPFRLVAIGYCGACYEEVIGENDQKESDEQT